MAYLAGMGRLVHKEVGGIRVVGFSLGGEETVVGVPEYSTCFDIGRAPREIISIDNVCLSHGHMDHAAGIAYYFSQRAFLGNSPGRVIAHHGLAPHIQALMAVWADIEGHPSPGEVRAVRHLDEVEIRKGLMVRAFNVNHPGCALGFTLVEVRHKLKAEFQGKTGPELVALKRAGVAIETPVEHAIVTFTGDTAIGAFLDLDFVRNSRVLIVECTFFDPEHRLRARAGRHIHVDDLPQVYAAVPAAQILLTHVSRRTEMRIAKRILERAIQPSDHSRTGFLMDRPARPRRYGEARPGRNDYETPNQPEHSRTGRT